MDAGLFPASVNVALTHGLKHTVKHSLTIELGASTLNFGREAGRAIIALTAIIAITSIVKTFISRPVIVQQAPPPAVDRALYEQIVRERSERKARKEAINQRESSNDSAVAKAVDTVSETPASAEIPAPAVGNTLVHTIEASK